LLRCGVAGEGGRFADLHLDQFVRFELGVGLGDEGIGQPVVANLQDGREVMAERPQVPALLAGQLSQPVARVYRTALAARG